jgi:Putative addiction module component
MSVSMTHLLEEALLLPLEEQTELVEALLECAQPSEEFLDHQRGIVSARMKRVQQGSSFLIDASDAHEQVQHSLKIRA